VARIVSNFFISLDGVVEAPDQWHFPYFNDEMGAAVERGMESSGAFLMGRVLYDEWSAYWPSHADGDFGPFINNAKKYVVSDSLDTATWNNTTVIAGEAAAEELRALKQHREGDIAMSGSATLVRWLLRNGLLDELRLLVHPIVVGHGRRLFDDVATHPLELVASETFSTGVLDLVYAPAQG